MNTLAPRDRFVTLATIASSLLIAFPLLVSSFVKAVLFAGNPARVDITNGLAYLRELLGFGSLGLIVVIIIVLHVIARRRTGSFASLRLSLAVLAIQVVVGLAVLAFTAISNNAHDSYVGALGF